MVSSSPNDMNNVKAGQTNSLWLKQYETLPNYSQKHALTSKIVLQVRLFNQHQHRSDTESDPHWRQLGLTCKTNK